MIKKTNSIQIATELFNKGLYEEAQQIIKQLDLSNVEVRRKANLISAAIAIRLGDTQKAIDLIDELDQQKHALGSDFINLKAVALRTQGRLVEARDLLNQAVIEYPRAIDLAHNLALTEADLSNYENAIQAGKKALLINPNFVESLKNLARVYITLRDTANAKEIFARLKAIDAQSLDALVGEGAVELIENRPREAAIKFEECLKINPKLGPAWANLGICYKYLGQYHKAKECLERACQVEPTQIEHQWNKTLVQLALGEYAEGWQNYEVRYDPKRIATDRVILPKSPVPMLSKAHSADGKKIVILQEQGFGDNFQFLRFTQNLKREGAEKIVAIVSKELKGVIRTIPWIDEVHHEMISPKEMPDYWVFAMSLPARYEIQRPEQINVPIPYIDVLTDKNMQWQQKLAHLNPAKLRVGLVWAGRPTHSNDSNRSMSLSTLNRLATFQDQVEFISLQKGERENDLAGADWQIHRFGNQIEDFSDSAALLANIDLLISIDSAPVHLAGALGMPVWTLLPAVFDFRWMVDRLDTPWYPTMKLFRQEVDEGWGPVIERLGHALHAWILTTPKRWHAQCMDLHPKAKASNAAGVNLYIQSAYQYHLQNEFAIAQRLYEKALRYSPHNIDAIRNLAALYRTIGKIDKALQMYQIGCQLNPKDSVFYSNYANLLRHLGRLDAALEAMKKALEIDPQNGVNWATKSEILEQMGRRLDAISANAHALSWSPSPAVFRRHVLLYLKVHENALAKEYLGQLLANTPQSLENILLAAYVHQELGELTKALAYYDQAIGFEPQHPEIYINRAVLRAKMLDYSRAIEDARRCIALSPNYAEAHFHLGVYLLTTGQFEEGWREYEWRMDPRRIALERVIKPQLSMPMWQGEPLASKRILLMPEQGYGDYIQFIRYARQLKEQGATVIAAAKAPMRELLKTCPWVDEIANQGEQIYYHFWAFAMSLPCRFKTNLHTIPKDVPYLFANPHKIQQWNQFLYPGDRKKTKPLIALCWQGSPLHTRDQFRSIPLEFIVPLIRHDEFDFIGITHGQDMQSEYVVDGKPLRNAGPQIGNFADTAGIMEHVDLLISIDSAPVHIAGAMGKRCWVLIDELPDFRWMLERTDSPWYPNTTLYRKPWGGQWSSVIEKINQDLLIARF